jgi:DNA polymerase III epsilon subunit-like protein
MNVAFLDVETTGLDPQENELLEVAFILRSDDPRTADQEVYFSLPIHLSRSSAQALEVNRFYERQDELDVLRVTYPEALHKLARLKGALVVGNNVQFDLRFIEAFLNRHEAFLAETGVESTTPWYYSPLDLKAFVAGRCGMLKPASTKLIAEVAGIPLPKDAHTALADARWNAQVYDALQHAPSWRPVV